MCWQEAPRETLVSQAAVKGKSSEPFVQFVGLSSLCACGHLGHTKKLTHGLENGRRRPCQRHSAPCWPDVLYFGRLPSLRLQEEACSVCAQEGKRNQSSTLVNCIYVRGCQ